MITLRNRGTHSYTALNTIEFSTFFHASQQPFSARIQFARYGYETVIGQVRSDNGAGGDSGGGGRSWIFLTSYFVAGLAVFSTNNKIQFFLSVSLFFPSKACLSLSVCVSCNPHHNSLAH